MKKTIAEYVKKQERSKVRTRRLVATLSILSLFVAAGVFWQLRIVGITKTDEPCCGLAEHQHDESCGISRVLICGLEEGPGEPQLICELAEHTHTETCYETVRMLICTESDAAHEHDDSCYEVRQTLICDLTEHTHGDDCRSVPAGEHIHTEECYKTVYGCGLEEHKHTVTCYPDLSADVESMPDWVATLPTDLSGIRRNDLVSIARSQIGYTESQRNFTLAEDGETLRYYSRYGEWYGNPYGNWDAMFASFCCYYAGMPQNEFPYAGGGTTWVAELQAGGLFEYPAGYTPQIGDLVFLDLQTDGYENHVGIVCEVTDTSIATIEGDVDGQVRQASYEVTDSRIRGYGRNDSTDGQPPDHSEHGSEDARETVRCVTCEGPDYSVSVSITAEAAIPETAELSVRELEQDSAEYNYYYQRTMRAMQLDTEPAFCRFFDVSFVHEGMIVEPMAPVDVKISYAETLPLVEADECTAVHFADDGLELLDVQIETTEEGDAVSFTQDSFSIVGTVIESAVTLINGNRYVFYTGDGYALGVTGDSDSGYSVQSLAINIGNNGYITPTDNTLSIDNISWVYNSTYGLYSPAAQRTLNFIASEPQVVGTMNAFTSTLGLMNAYSSVSSKIINNSVRLVSQYDDPPYGYTGGTSYMLAYMGGQFISGTAFISAQTYFLTANVAEVSDELVDPGILEVTDDIRQSGHIKPVLTGTIPGTTATSTYTYLWEKSVDGGSNWNDVVRKKITGDYYNVADDGSWLNVALDKGAEAQYRVSLVAVDGTTLATPIRSLAYFVPYFDRLKNGDFEDPVVPLTTNPDDYQPFLANGTYGMIWKTTATDGQIEYVSVAQDIYRDYSLQWHRCEDADSGVQYVELNATQEGALYQDVLTVPGSVMYWQLSHRGRGNNYQSGETDTMYVVIMSTEMAEEHDITSTDKVKDVIDHQGDYPGASVVTVQSDNKSWHTNNGAYTVPEGQYLSRYFFVAGKAVSGDNSIGNHLDNVSFSTDLPLPAPDKTNVAVIKTVEGLSYDDAYELFGRMEFSIYELSTATHIKTIGINDFGLISDNGDGTYSGSYTAQGLEPGQYIVYENMNDGKADKTGYIRTTSVTSVNGNGTSNFAGGYYSQVVDAPAMGTASVTFRNSYVRETTSITLEKDGTDGAPLVAEFELAVQGGSGWTSVGGTVRTAGGAVQLSDLLYDTLYRLTETKAPDGYIGRATPVYFKLTAGGIVFYDETGATVVENIDGVTADLDLLDGMSITVVNQPGFVLPSTGGMGTLIFTVTGLLLIAGSIVIRCVLRRKCERRLRI